MCIISYSSTHVQCTYPQATQTSLPLEVRARSGLNAADLSGFFSPCSTLLASANPLRTDRGWEYSSWWSMGRNWEAGYCMMVEGEWRMTTSPPGSSTLRFQLPWDMAERYSSWVRVRVWWLIHPYTYINTHQ